LEYDFYIISWTYYYFGTWTISKTHEGFAFSFKSRPITLNNSPVYIWLCAGRCRQVYFEV